ncbi:MAG: MFS transporter [Chloroflexi bacterium]|nr:MFS transporter [Chloroflexota bacterium]
MSDYVRLLRSNRNFSLLWWAQVVSLTGDWFNTVVLGTLVSRYAGPERAGLAVAALFLARFLPPLLVSPWAGVLVDRFDRKTLLIYSNLLRAVVVCGFLLATAPEMLWLIYFLTVIQFVLSAVFEPGQSALLPALVDERDLVTANTLASVTWSAMLALGALLGGVVSALLGAAAALLFDALSFLLAAGLIAAIKVNRQAQTAHPARETAESGGFREGLRYVAAHPSTLAVLLVKAGNSLGNVDTLMTIFATQIFILGSDGQLSLGILYSAFGFGAVIGPFIANRFNDGSVGRMRRLVVAGFALAFAGWLVLGGAAALWIAALAMIVRAMGGSINWTYSSVIIQKTVPDRFLGRVFAFDMAGFQLATVLSTLVHGSLVTALGNGAIHWVALGTSLVALLPLGLWGLAVRHMEVSATAADRAAL